VNPYLRKCVDAAEGYVPGEQPAPGQAVTKINTNENPYPPSPRLVEVLEGWEIDRLRIYPDPLSKALRAAASEAWHHPVEGIVAGNGSDEILAMLFRAALDPGERVVFADPSYILYDTLARLFGGTPVPVPCGEDFALPGNLAEVPGKLVLLASPNPPAGRAFSNETVDAVCRARKGQGIVVVDEAYADFADHSSLPLLSEHENLVVVRTLSKSYGLAGLRVGFALGNAPVLAGLWKVRDSYNVDALAQALAAAALLNQAYFSERVATIRRDRNHLRDRLLDLGFAVPPSDANFVFASHPEMGGREVYDALRARGILVRHFTPAKMAHGVRITVGSPEQNERLLAALNDILTAKV